MFRHVLAFACLLLLATAQYPGVITLAGGATQCSAPGTNDGVGSAAGFESPAGVVQCAVANCTTLYVSDTDSHRIRTVDTITAVTSFLAGDPSTSPVSGSTDGVYSAARFNSPSGLAVDFASTLYVADKSNNLIRKLAAGNVSTFAGGGGSIFRGFADGIGTSALFYGPYALALWAVPTAPDSPPNSPYFLFVLDAKNNAIRSITVGTGTVSTIAGNVTAGYADGDGSSARFNFQSVGGLVTDGGASPLGIYVMDYGNNVIRKVAIASPPRPFSQSL